SLFHQERTKDCSAIRLIQAGAQELAEPMQPVAIASSSAGRPFDGLDVELLGWDEATFEAERAALVAAAHTQHNTSATALGRSDEAKDQPEDESEPWSRGRAGTHLGRAVHAALQTLHWD